MKVSAFVLATTTLIQPIAAALCPLTFEGLSGLDTEYSFTALGKLNVLSFSATVTYATLPSGKWEVGRLPLCDSGSFSSRAPVV